MAIFWTFEPHIDPLIVFFCTKNYFDLKDNINIYHSGDFQRNPFRDPKVMGQSSKKKSDFPYKWQFLEFESSIKNEPGRIGSRNLAKMRPVCIRNFTFKIESIALRPTTAIKNPHFCLNKDLSPLRNGSQRWTLTHSVSFVPHCTPLNKYKT